MVDKMQRGHIEGISPPVPVERMPQTDLQVFVTSLDIPSTSDSILKSCVRRILVFPDDDSILRKRLEVIRYELGDRHLNRVFRLSLIASFI